MLKGFCCNDPKVGSNKLLSCAQACAIRKSGVTEENCKTNCIKVGKDKKCDNKIKEESFSLCDKCTDLKSNCPQGVQSVDECS